jgi:hypothetical protein
LIVHNGFVLRDLVVTAGGLLVFHAEGEINRRLLNDKCSI